MALLTKTKNYLERIQKYLHPEPTREVLTMLTKLTEELYDKIQNTPECTGDLENLETKRLDQCLNELAEMIDDFQVKIAQLENKPKP